MFYTIHNILPINPNKYDDAVISEGDTEHDAISDAEDYFRESDETEGFSGDNDINVYLVEYDDEGEIKDKRVVTLTWFASDENYVRENREYYMEGRL